MSDRWTLNAQAAPAWHHWEGETVVHHRLSNDTHRLADPAGRVLDALHGQGAQTVDALAAAGDIDPGQLSPVLDALASLGLIVRC